MDWGIDLMDKLKLQWKIFGFLLGFCVLLLAMLWLFQTVLLSDMYKFVRKVEIDKAISLVERNINSMELENVLYELELTNEITVRPTKDFNPSAPPDLVHRMPETITKTKNFTLDDGSQISLTFYAKITPVDATVSTLQKQLYIITIFMVILATLLAVIISKRISTPIERINRSAKTLAKGDYETEFHARGFLEICELSDTLNKAALELSKVERHRRELMANISHDLRTPLALIFSYAEMMSDFPNEITAEHSQIIMDEARRLTSLVNDVLDISNIEMGMDKINKSHYNFTKSLIKTVERIRELTKTEQYNIELIYDREIFLLADEVKITQTIYNLILNAITHCGGDKAIIVRQIAKDNFVRIEVMDHGEGIDDADLPYIWERYYKVDKKHKRPIVGTGLGLSIVKKIIEMHDGSYGVESQLGKGSNFWFELKIKQ